MSPSGKDLPPRDLPPSAVEIAHRVRSGELEARAVVAHCLERIAAADGELKAFRHVDAEGALELAARVDAGERKGALAGVPVALKSNLCRAGQPTDCGSRILENYRATYTGTAVERLLRAGAIPVGTTHMDEFAMGSSGENSAFASTRNPWDPSRVPGGSSSGSAAAVAAGFVPIAIGSDTGGSVRQPASFCGLVGHKPSYGRVSRYGLVAFASSLDQVAPFARSVEDVELVLSVLAGSDERDATTLRGGAFAPGELPTRWRLGTAPELLPASVDAPVAELFSASLTALEQVGGARVSVDLPHAPRAIPTYYVVATAEASSNLARYDGVRYGLREEGDGSLAGMMSATRAAGLGPEVERRILLGTHVLSSGYHEAWYGRAQRVRQRIASDFEAAFEKCDLIACPTSPTVAFALGDRVRDPIAMYAADVLTVPANLAGLPAVSVPCGSVEENGRRLPVGLQLIGPQGSDERVLAAARAFQAQTSPGGWPAATLGGPA